MSITSWTAWMVALLPAVAPTFSLAGQGGRVSVSEFADFGAGMAVRQAVAGAARRLAIPACARVVEDFEDPLRRPLSMRLEVRGITLREHLATLRFVDNSSSAPCQKAVLAFTAPDDRTIRICGPAFKSLFDNDRRLAELIIIHEVLHSLGLGENPPTGTAINARIAARCG